MREGWRHTTIGEIGRVVGGSTPSTRNPGLWGGGIPWITPSEVTGQEGRRIDVTSRSISAAGLASIGGNLLPAGTVLLTSRATVGAVALAGVPMAVNQGFAAIVAGSDVLPEWLMLWCQLNRPYFEALAGGSTFPEVSKLKVRAVKLELPTVAEQRRIVDLVSRADEVVHSGERLLASVDGSTAAVRDGAFAAETAEAQPLRELCDRDGIQIGPFGSQLHARDYVANGIPVVMPQDMVDGQISEDHIARVSPFDANRLKRHWLEPQDILLSRRGDLSKRAYVLAHQRGWLCGTGSVRVRVSKVAPEAVFEALSTSETNAWLADHAVGITLPNLNTEIVGSVPVRLPASPNAAVRVLAEMRAVRSQAKRMIRAARTVRDTLVSDLLDGASEIPPSYDRFLDGAA